MIEAAFAAHGYTVDAPVSRRVDGTNLMLMTRGDGGVLLSHNKASELAEIDIWGMAQSAASIWLESLPLRLEKRSLVASRYCGFSTGIST